MNILKLNETPIRTSKNFNINNIKIDDDKISKIVNKFNNVKIIGENSRIENDTSDIKLTYGLSEYMTEQVKKQSNQKLKLILDSKKNKETQIEFKLDQNNKELVEDLEIITNEGTVSTIVIKYLSDENVQGYHNGIIRIKAKNNSKLDVIIINLMNSKSNNYISIENTIEENAEVKYTIIDIGGNNSVSNYYSNILGENAKNDLKTIYLGRNTQIKDINYIAELKGEKSYIDIDVQGALKDTAKKNFKGTIDFKKGSKKAKGNENEYCMLLSDKAKSIALPMLLCTEEDVEGNHSTASGKADEKELFYIMTRGISYNEAIKLIVKARFNKIIDRIKNEEIREQILNEIDKRLD